MAELRQVPIYRALNRPNLLMGGDRELVLVTILSTLFLIVLLASWYTVAIGTVVWFAGMWGLPGWPRPIRSCATSTCVTSSMRSTTTPSPGRS